ncbi:MAG: beta-lactamase family protein [Gammaproteobacteria bacterium]|nr:beta-lactamase family protein [Gammaproteobacteria bacterium]
MNSFIVRWLISNIFSLLLVCVSVSPAFAEPAGEMEGFIDGIMQRAVMRGETVGATVSLVSDGRLVMAKGYGFANLQDRTPVQGRHTQFRIGSITKVLTWISVLQQIESGRLELDADVNVYLESFAMEDKFSDPITLRHLMTHTPGFEDDLSRLFASGPRQVGILRDTLADHMPARVRPPGTVAAYSNYGAALAGFLVAKVSGEGWHDYVQTHIFGPLGMHASSTRQPLTNVMDQSRSRGYQHNAGVFQVEPFTFIPLAPAGSGSATALDVARLMVELLNPQSTGVLSAKSKQKLLEGAYLAHPEINGITLGMYEVSQGDARAVAHHGSTILFNSAMVLWPKHKVGLFVSTNTDSGMTAVNDLVDAFSVRMGFKKEDYTVAAQEIQHGASLAGVYISARRNLSNYTKVMALATTLQVSYDPLAQEITLAGGENKPYRQLESGALQQVGTSKQLAFVGESHNAALYLSDLPTIGYVRASRVETPFFNAMLLGGWVLLVLLAILYWPFSSMAHRGQRGVLGQRFATILVVSSWGCFVMFLLQVGGLADSTYSFLRDGVKQLPGLLWWMFAFSGITALLVINLYRVWFQSFWWPSRRIHFTLIVFNQAAVVWWLWYWNLLPEQILHLVK